MNEFERNRSGGRYSSESSGTFVQLWLLLFCAVMCCTVIGCSFGFFVHGKIVDADGDPVADAKLVITAMNNEFISSESLSGADGAFTFRGTTSSRIEVSIISISVEKSGFAPVKMRLRLGNDYDDAEIVLVRLEECK